MRARQSRLRWTIQKMKCHPETRNDVRRYASAKNMSCSKIIRRRRREAETRNGYIQLLARIILVIVCGGLLFTQGFLLMRAPDNGMFPAIKGGDLLIGFRLQRNFLKNDVVVYKANGKLQVGRILGQETDVITIDDTGQLLVNGTPQTGEIAFPTYAKKGIKKYPYRVPKGCVFLLGDYRTQTKDSRDYGPIKMEDVKAKVITVLRRREL